MFGYLNGPILFDQPVLDWFVQHRPHWLVDIAKVATVVGDFPVLIVLGLLTALVLRRLGARWPVALTPLASLFIAGAGVFVAKALFDRQRPPQELHLVAEMDASFPSGHATDSAALFVAIGILCATVFVRRRYQRIICVSIGVALAFLIGASRLVLGVHWPTDVVAGWILGTIVAVVVTSAAVRFFTQPSAPIPDSTVPPEHVGSARSG